MISVVIPTHNSSSTIEPLLSSIIKQDYKDYEIIVIDDCSSDDTVYKIKKSHVKLISLDTNSGPSRARNIGAESANGDILLFLDSDVILEEGVLRKISEWFERKGIDAVIGVYDSKPANKGFFPLYKAIQEQAWYEEIKGDKVTTFTPAIGAIRKDIFITLGGFHSSYKGADVEDYEFSQRLLEKTSIYIDKTIKVRHHFPSFKKLVKSYYRRCLLWMQLFKEIKRFDNNSTTASQAGISICNACVVFTFPLMFINVYLFLIPFFFFIISLILSRKHLLLIFKETSIGFLIAAIFINIFLSVVIVISAFNGLFFTKTRLYNVQNS